jgi:hypothetical protein
LVNKEAVNNSDIINIEQVAKTPSMIDESMVLGLNNKVETIGRSASNQ